MASACSVEVKLSLMKHLRRLSACVGFWLKVLPAVALLKEIELQTTKAGFGFACTVERPLIDGVVQAGRRDEWQLVGATAAYLW